METNKVLIVLGMHRSGTSLTAHWLHACGLNMGEVLHGPDIGNPDGHFEDIDFLRLHEAILEAHDYSPEGMLEKPILDLDDKFNQLIAALLDKKKICHKEWGWKDPRTCLFLEQYRSLLPGARYLILFRDYNEVVSSLVLRYFKVWELAHLSAFPKNVILIRSIYKKLWRKFKYSKNKAAFFAKFSAYYLRAWICYNEQLLLHIKAIQPGTYLFTDNVKLKQQSQNIFEVLKNDWGFDLREVSFESVYKPGFSGHYMPVGQYINDAALIEKAENLQRELQQMIKLKNN